MKYLIFSIVIIFTYAPFTYSQVDRVTRQELTSLANSANQDGIVRTLSVTEYKGTPYFNEWSKGHIIISENNITQPIVLRYDMEYDAIIFSRDDKIFSISNDKMNGFVVYTTTNDINFRNGFKTNVDDITNKTLLRIIYDGDIKLVAHHTSSLKENLATYGTANKLSAFENRTEFYLIDKNGVFQEVDLKEKDILKALGSMQDGLKKYADQNNLNFDQESDLKNILEYYDTLQ